MGSPRQSPVANLCSNHADSQCRPGRGPQSFLGEDLRFYEVTRGRCREGEDFSLMSWQLGRLLVAATP